MCLVHFLGGSESLYGVFVQRIDQVIPIFGPESAQGVVAIGIGDVQVELEPHIDLFGLRTLLLIVVPATQEDLLLKRQAREQLVCLQGGDAVIPGQVKPLRDRNGIICTAKGNVIRIEEIHIAVPGSVEVDGK
ncbi:hypothetical protein CHT99_01325 [Sphingobacterium cellulitidis]|nr:hypothetical protein CHT99_01325 [Sphingobacterium cellulitidis]